MKRKLVSILGLILVQFSSSIDLQASSQTMIDLIPFEFIYDKMERRDFDFLNKIALVSNSSLNSKMAQSFLHLFTKNKDRIFKSFDEIINKRNLRYATTPGTSKILAFFNSEGDVIATIAHSQFRIGSIAPIYLSDYTERSNFFEEGKLLLAKYHNKQKDLFDIMEYFAKIKYLSFIRFEYSATGIGINGNHTPIQVTERFPGERLNRVKRLVVDAIKNEAINKIEGNSTIHLEN